MKTTLVYTYVSKAQPFASVHQDDYYEAARRFVGSLLKCPDRNPMDVIVVCCGSEPTRYDEELFGPVRHRFVTYLGNGKDCGAYLHAAKEARTQFGVFMASHTYWRDADALDILVGAFERHGDGLYGPFGSFEISPHIRTSCIAAPIDDLLAYPHALTQYQDANRFECGDISFTRWMVSRGRPCLMVTRSGDYELPNWRKPLDVFWKGDQSDCLFCDRYTDRYESASEEERRKMERKADGV